MKALPYRQVHLDFHTSELVPGVGSEFSPENFEKCLRLGHVNSITLFSKCHHGWSYHPTRAGEMNPSLEGFDLLGEQIKVCKRLGIRVQVYISAGIDGRLARLKPQWQPAIGGVRDSTLGPYFHSVCLGNDEYLQVLEAQTVEVLEMFGKDIDGIFYDICMPRSCLCESCIDSMLEKGLDPENPEDVCKHGKLTYYKYSRRMNSVVARYYPNMPVIHNQGTLPRDDRRTVYSNLGHLELEALPTGGWGYDYFPLSAAYARTIGKDFAGMTGKFHLTWGEFGGYKHPNALRYETSLQLALGARCNIGDQCHPSGALDEATYRLIGKAYSEVEKKEEYCIGARHIADIALMTTFKKDRNNKCADTGANRILVEGHYLYNIIDEEADFSEYKLIILPDTKRVGAALGEKLRAFLAGGGKLLMSGSGGLLEDRDEFFADFGVRYVGENSFRPTYMRPKYDMEPSGIASYVVYDASHLVEAYEEFDGDIPLILENSYFNRTYRHYCSHRHTPNNSEDCHIGAVLTENIAYIAWNIFSEYGELGSINTRYAVTDLIDRLLGDEWTLRTSLPSCGVTTLTRQEERGRYICHLLYAVTKVRGRNTEIVEDIIPIFGTDVEIRLSARPRRVYLAPEGRDLPFEYKEGRLSFTVDAFECHGMVVIEE